MKITLSKVFKDALTASSGEYDPARIIGYLGAAGGFIVYLGSTVYVVWKQGTLDWTAWGVGFAGVSAACIAAALGVNIKKSSEGPPEATNSTEPK